jgi:hypothetical protein
MGRMTSHIQGLVPEIGKQEAQLSCERFAHGATNNLLP